MPKEIPSCLIAGLLVVFTWQLEILVTTLVYLFNRLIRVIHFWVIELMLSCETIKLTL